MISHKIVGYWIYFSLVWTLTSCIPSECPQVIEIWLAMGGSPNEVLQDCCAMSRVTCNDSGVTSINWSFKGLNGGIPSEIGALVNLKSL